MVQTQCESCAVHFESASYLASIHRITPPSKKGKLEDRGASTAATTQNLPSAQSELLQRTSSLSTLNQRPSTLSEAHTNPSDPAPAITSTRTRELDADHEAEVVEKYGGYGEDETEEQLNEDRLQLPVERSGKAERSTAQVRPTQFSAVSDIDP